MWPLRLMAGLYVSVWVFLLFLEFECSIQMLNSGTETHTHSTDSCACGYEKRSKSYGKTHFSAAPLTDTHRPWHDSDWMKSDTKNRMLSSPVFHISSQNYFLVTKQLLERHLDASQNSINMLYKKQLSGQSNARINNLMGHQEFWKGTHLSLFYHHCLKDRTIHICYTCMTLNAYQNKWWNKIKNQIYRQMMHQKDDWCYHLMSTIFYFNIL